MYLPYSPHPYLNKSKCVANVPGSVIQCAINRKNLSSYLTFTFQVTRQSNCGNLGNNSGNVLICKDICLSWIVITSQKEKV